MAIARTIPALYSLVRRFRRDSDGVSAVEFAIVLPFMVTLYLGGVELGNGLAVQFKTTLAARTVADLASQYVTIGSTDASNILGAATTVITPYSSANMVVTLSEVTVNNVGKGIVQWSCSLHGTKYPLNTQLTMPTNLQTNGITLLFGEVTYPYTPQLGYVITGTINIYQGVYFYPRLTSTVTGPSSC